ncbi:transcription factor FER-LIKE IRON DEFICIENCY-INDUCED TRANSCRIPTION FACTOR isoform X1 [Brassica rapa]|uniref:transcription factor FER-LIKE IRON DEFICIENCY-INDUCED TRANSCRIPTION FACTOR isoform X1 n=1 Tax=Brassica campestris TaxID=3711 RepID=UPI00142E7C2A|nr:transcription factor FER-LIKE IRON DEFICIENCY-INDUCED TRANSCRIPTION FACTOR isoform X1 [Brassica rapa]XP_048592828.1 transcription factor FER-LIKE IRON DEFICIENCY-INDUCED TRANSCRIPTION FACTOR-like isoform X1 [Brassica napus]
MKGRVIALTNLNDLELHNFLVDPNFDQFINLIRGDDQTIEHPPLDFDLGGPLHNSPCFIDDNQFIPTPVDDLFDELPDIDSNVAESFRSFEGESVVRASGEDDYNDGDDSSATTTNNDGSRKKKTDRSRTLISERKRRGRMKDKLYALRSLVPNITKMDKASIVGDAVAYVQELQSQAKKLKADIAGLEASLTSTEGYQEPAPVAQKSHTFRCINPPVSKKISQMDVIQVEEKEFYVRLVCNKGEGVAASLYKSLESLTSFQVQNSNLSSPSPDTYLLTYTLDVNQLVPFYIFCGLCKFTFTKYRVCLFAENRGHVLNRA